MSSNRETLESAIRTAVTGLAPNITGDGLDWAVHYVAVWRTFDADNDRLYRELESKAEVGGRVWRKQIDCLVARVRHELPRMATIIADAADKPTKEE